MVTHLIADGRWYPWVDVETLDPRPRLRTVEPAPPVRHSLLLDRHVLDSQIVDLAGKRVRRVGDVELAEDAGRLRLVAVDVGAAASWAGSGCVAPRAGRVGSPSTGAPCTSSHVLHTGSSSTRPPRQSTA